MTREEMKAKMKEMAVQINDLQAARAELAAQYCAEFAPFKIGQVIEWDGGVRKGIIKGRVLGVSILDYMGGFEYRVAILRSDGKDGRRQTTVRDWQELKLAE